MEYGHDIICPQCRIRHGPAAKSCDCGYVFKVAEEDPAPAMHFVIAGIVMLLGSVGVAWLADKRGLMFLPIFGVIGAGVAFTLAVRSWLYFLRKK